MRVNRQQRVAVDFRLAVKNQASSSSTLFSKGKMTTDFFTEDSKLYITPREQRMLTKGVKLNRGLKDWDCLSARVKTEFVRYQPSETSLLSKYLEKRYQLFDEATAAAAESIMGQFSMVRLWNASIVGSILFGMVMMTFVYRYLGQGVSASVVAQPQVAAQAQVVATVPSVNTEDDAESFAQQVAQLQQTQGRQDLEKEIRDMVKGYPIENQAPYIAQQDRTVAAFYVAIAKKESAWGKRVPVRNGQDCFNYVGYRGIRDKMGTGGHTCFDSPQDAVETVTRRIRTLVEKQGMTTPEKMVNIWKCGSKSNCGATGGQAAADKWAADVKGIFAQFSENEK